VIPAPIVFRQRSMVQLRENPELQSAYRAAIEDRADSLADDIIALADSEPPAHLDGAALSAWVQQLQQQFLYLVASNIPQVQPAPSSSNSIPMPMPR